MTIQGTGWNDHDIINIIGDLGYTGLSFREQKHLVLISKTRAELGYIIRQGMGVLMVSQQ